MSEHCFELRAGKISTRRRAPTEPALPFAHEEDLQALVAGWPWISAAPPLLLAEEDDPVTWVGDGGDRSDLLGVSSKGRAVAAELLLEPFVGRKPAMKSLLRGLCRLHEHGADPARVLSPYPLDAQQPMTAILVGDGTVFPKDDKQLKKISKDWLELLAQPGEAWSVRKDDEKDRSDRRTPAWVGSLGGQPLHFVVLSLLRHLDGRKVVVTCRRHLLLDGNS
ncbi:MAG: hypothetical protein ABIJ09_21005 [Pseudomonadota bacterium]